MSLANPEHRRGLRSIIYAVVSLFLLAILWKLSDMLHASEAGLREIARGSLIITGIGMIGYIAENGIRAISLKGPGDTEISLTTDDAPSVTTTTTTEVQP